MRLAPFFTAAALALCAAAAPALAQSYSAAECPPCAEWISPQQPFRIHGNTYYVGTPAPSAILVTSPEGHVLIDDGLPQSALLILSSIRALVTQPADHTLILNSHARYDHAGGIGLLQRATGARVAATAWSARVLAAGAPGRDDPQHEVALPYPPASRIIIVEDRAPVHVGPLVLNAHLTAGHTPGGT